MEVVKIRLQAQMHSLADPNEVPQYRNAGHAVYKIVREEGVRALYRGVSLTALRQATNQGAVGSRCSFEHLVLTGIQVSTSPHTRNLKSWQQSFSPTSNDFHPTSTC